MANDSDDDSVGYGRPPRKNQYKAGQSGNRAGRPKGSKNVAALLNKVLNERITITEKGQRKSVTKVEAALKQIINKAVLGDLKALQIVLGLHRSLIDSAAAVGATSAIEELREQDKKILDAFKKRAAKTEGESDE